MVSIATLRKLALAFEEAVEQPHFEKSSFRINKKIFITLDSKNKKAVLKLPEIDQSVFCAFDKSVIYPAGGAWGKHGWTVFELKKIKKNMFQDAMQISYSTVATKRLSGKMAKPL